MDDYGECDATELAARVRRGDIHPRELVEHAISQVEAANPRLNAVVHRMYDEARAAAAKAPDGPFRGVPMVVKDFDGFVKGHPFTASTRFLDGFVPDHDSEALARLRRAGLVFLAKTNCPELAIVATTEPEWRGAARNPWDLERSPGGSSGGSGALVAARAVPLGHGGDGGGSLRIPAADCGLVGFKASRGRVPLGPDWGEGWGGFVQWGVLTRTVRDAAAMLDIMAGPMAGDPYAAPPLDGPLAQEVGRDPGKLRVAFWRGSLYGNEQHPDNVAAVDATAKALAALGHEVEEAKPPFDRRKMVLGYLTQIASGIAAEIEDFARWTGRTPSASSFEPGTWFLAQVGRTLTALDLLHARDAGQEAGRAMGAFHQKYDVLVTATTAYPAVRLGELSLKASERAGLAALRAAPIRPVLRAIFHSLADKNLERTPNTQLFNQTGQPAIGLPLHWTAQGLPIGVQISAAYGGEALLTRLAGQLESAMPWAARRPTA